MGVSLRRFAANAAKRRRETPIMPSGLAVNFKKRDDFLKKIETIARTWGLDG
jgi:hypothetical protein